jgi:hypothetical protein
MTTTEISKRFEVHPIMITQWKKHAVDLLPSLFSKKPAHVREEWALRESELFQQIGQLLYELEWLKKKTDSGFPPIKNAVLSTILSTPIYYFPHSPKNYFPFCLPEEGKISRP